MMIYGRHFSFFLIRGNIFEAKSMATLAAITRRTLPWNQDIAIALNDASAKLSQALKDNPYAVSAETST